MATTKPLVWRSILMSKQRARHRRTTTAHRMHATGLLVFNCGPENFSAPTCRKRCCYAFVRATTGSLAGLAAFFVPAKECSMTVDVLRGAALWVSCLLGLWTSVACRR